MAEQSLKDKTIKGTAWSAADVFLGQGVTFFVGLVLARLLTPSEYGLVGICTIITTVLTGIVDSGFSNALIRKKNATNEDYNTMFITNMVVSVVLFVLLYISSPLIADFFGILDLVMLIRVMGLILIFQALSLVQITILTKKIDFKTKTKASLVSALLSGVVGIAMAFTGFGVWSLVAQQLSKNFLYTICIWLLNKWWPSLQFNNQSLSYMWGYGWKLMLSGLLNNIWNQLYQVIVGKCYSPATLGQYSRSKEYASIFSINLTMIVQRVSLPVLAEVQDDKTRMVSAYRKVIKTTMFLSVIVLFFLGAIADPLIYCLIGPQWHEAATYLPFICISLSLFPLQAINLNMLQIQNRTDIFLYLEILKKIIAIGPLCLGIFVSIYWMLVGSIIVGIVGFFLNSYYTGRELSYSSWMQLKDVAPNYGVAIIIALSVYFLKYLPINNWVILPIQVVVGTIVFIVLNECINLPEYKEVKVTAREYVEAWIKRNK